MRLGDLAGDDVPTAGPETTVGELTAAMRNRGVDSVVVLDEGTPLGLVTAADVGRVYVEGEVLDSQAVADLLPENPVTLREGADLPALLAEFEATGAREAVVVDDAGEYVGVVTLGDALVAFGEELSEVLALFEGSD
ncbi:CBS domain-containing protein [Halobium salinum]|uniref:CBS domain-containing protein n=1 Tax=Halobium salinum TaxID=1364940 RepID=A0ABD5PBI9_9EURY|nr:CBS domain-containing protein [Halobium salinum]